MESVVAMPSIIFTVNYIGSVTEKTIIIVNRYSLNVAISIFLWCLTPLEDVDVGVRHFTTKTLHIMIKTLTTKNGVNCLDWQLQYNGFYDDNCKNNYVSSIK